MGQDHPYDELYAKIGESTVERDFFGAGSRAEPDGSGADDRAGRTADPVDAERAARCEPVVAVLTGRGGSARRTWRLMRHMDELHMEYPFYGSRQMMRYFRREGLAVARHRIRRFMRLMGMEATCRRPRTSVGGRTPGDAYRDGAGCHENVRRNAVPGAQPASRRLRAWRDRRAPVPSAFPSGAGSVGKTAAGFKPGSGGRVRTGRSGTVAVLGPTRSPRPQPRSPRALETTEIHHKLALGLSKEVEPPQAMRGHDETYR